VKRVEEPMRATGAGIGGRGAIWRAVAEEVKVGEVGEESLSGRGKANVMWERDRRREWSSRCGRIERG